MSDEGKLIIVATPIGNLGDITLRCLEALREADAVCAEDTRVTAGLLSAYGISKPLERLDEAKMAVKSRAIVDRALAGETIAYCSDAGMPGVSDPGMRLIEAARQAGVPVEVLPGATAAVTAYVQSASECPSFYFGAFFPRKEGERVRLLESLKDLDAALVFYESPHRLLSSLESIAQAFPERTVTVCRELTKLHEECVKGTPASLLKLFADREREGRLRGEIVIVIDAAADAERAAEALSAQREARLRAAELAAEGMRAKEIVKNLTQDFGISRNDAYGMATEAISLS